MEWIEAIKIALLTMIAIEGYEGVKALYSISDKLSKLKSLS